MKKTIEYVVREEPFKDYVRASVAVHDLVRCKDCRFHGYNTYTKVHYCRRPHVVLEIKEDDFCSRGERKDGDDGQI